MHKIFILIYLFTFQIQAQNFYQWGTKTKTGDPRGRQCSLVAPYAERAMSCSHTVQRDGHWPPATGAAEHCL